MPTPIIPTAILGFPAVWKLSCPLIQKMYSQRLKINKCTFIKSCHSKKINNNKIYLTNWG